MKRNETGFTLIEIMIAMVILLVGLLALISFLNYGFFSTKRSEDKMRTLNYARQKLEEIEDMNFYYIGVGNPGFIDTNLNHVKDLTESNLFGTTLVGNTSISWSVEVQSVDDAADGLAAFDTFGDTTDYKRLILTTSWTDQKGTVHSENMQTFVGPRLLAGGDTIGPAFICQVTPGIAAAGTISIRVSASEKLNAIPTLNFVPAYGTPYQGSAIVVTLKQASDYDETLGNYLYENLSPINITQGNSSDPTDGPTPDGTALITVTGSDVAGNPGSSTSSFIIDTTPPQVTPPPVLNPPSPVEAGISEMVQIAMSDSLGVYQPLLWYQVGSFSSTIMNIVSGDSTSGTWEGTIPYNYILDRNKFSTTSDVQFYFEARDGAGNYGTSTIYYVGVRDTTPPVITTTPVTSAIESTEISIDATITDFMGVDSTTVGPYIGYQSIDSTYSTTARMSLISGTINNGNWRATIPAEVIRDWSGDSNKDVIYYIAAWDAAGNLVTSPAGIGNVYDITVISSDTTPPALSNKKPADGATDVSLDTTMGGTFSEAMIESTITNSSNVKLLEGGVNQVAATITYNPVNYSFVLAPSSNLNYQTTYTAVVTTGVKDLSGNSMASQESWSFTTINAPVATFYFHSENSPYDSTFKNLSKTGPDKAAIQEVDLIVGAAGEYIYGDWLSDSTFVNPSGVWNFNIWANNEHGNIQGTFYAKIYYSTGVLFWTTVFDNENVKDFVGSYHQYSWSETITSGAVNDKLRVRIIFKASRGQSNKHLYVGYDHATYNSNIFITFIQ